MLRSETFIPGDWAAYCVPLAEGYKGRIQSRLQKVRARINVIMKECHEASLPKRADAWALQLAAAEDAVMDGTATRFRFRC